MASLRQGGKQQRLLAKGLNKSGQSFSGLLPVAADVTQETGRQALVEAALARHGRIGLVNNVGTAFRRASPE